MKSARVLLIAFLLVVAVGVPNGFAKFSGREILDNILNGMSGGRRGDQNDNTQKKKNRGDRAAPDSYEETEHQLALLEAALQLQPQQKAPWQLFAAKVGDYAGELSRERARVGIPAPEGTPIGGLEHIDQLTDLARTRLSKLEDIRSAATKLYATLSSDQKKIADLRIVTIVSSPDGPSQGDDRSDDNSVRSARGTRR